MGIDWGSQKSSPHIKNYMIILNGLKLILFIIIINDIEATLKCQNTINDIIISSLKVYTLIFSARKFLYGNQSSLFSFAKQYIKIIVKK